MQRFATLVLILLVFAATLSACKSGPTQAELYEKARKAQEESNFAGAVEAYQEIVKRFPKSSDAPQCQFMVGYLYANHIKNIELARQAYQTFIRNYPEHELIKDAQWELDHLGMDVNQIKELNRMLEKDSVSKGALADTTKK